MGGSMTLNPDLLGSNLGSTLGSVTSLCFCFLVCETGVVVSPALLLLLLLLLSRFSHVRLCATP